MAEKPGKKAQRYQLGEDMDEELAALSAGYKGAPATGLIREAVELYIDKCIAEEPAVKSRYKAAGGKRG